VTDLANLGAAAATEAVATGACTSEALVSACLGRIAEREPTVRAFVDLDPDRALAQARAADRTPREGRGALHGVPVAIKEIFDVAGMRCAWGTPIHAGRVATADSAVARRFRAAGAVILGTTVSTEYAIANAGPTTNPHDSARTPGGSSSGSAAAVAAGMVPLALASQTIGSIVRPATYCGVYGLKPTKGAISCLGGMALSPALDHPGPVARETADIALACRVLFGVEADDPESMAVAPPELRPAPPGLRVLLVEGPLRARIEPPSREALDRARAALEASGLTVRAHGLPASFESAEGCQDILLCCGVAQHHGGDRDQAGDRMSERVRGLIDRGRTISDTGHEAALAEAGGYRAALMELLAGDTVILAAAADGVAPPRGDGSATGSPLLQGLWTLTGLPALAMPCGLYGGLPIGVQLIAAPGREDLLLAAAGLARKNL
jgi:Asp-tRNA(Asn)/Glu-tRNA(Gln) amidotransferase A subunit family amidase